MSEEFESEDFLLPDDLMGDLGGKTLDEIRNGLIEFAQNFHDELHVKTEAIMSDFQSKASDSVSSTDLQQALQVDIVAQASQANELFNEYYEVLNDIGKELDVEALSNLQEDIKLFKESLEDSTRNYVEGLQSYADSLEAQTAKPLSPQEISGAEGFPVINPDDIAPEKILANIKSEGETKARQLLERYLRDFEKQVNKKLLQVETNVAQFEIKGAPRAETEERLNELVQGMLDKKVADLEQLGLTVDKEFDNIDTRLRTMRGVEEDFDEINALKDQIDKTLKQAKSEYENAAQSILERGRDSINSRNEKREQKAAVDEAQEKAEEAYRDFVEQNQDRIQPNFGETLMAAVADIVSPYSALHRDSDKRYDRLQDLKSDANDVAQQIFNDSLESSGQDPGKEGMPGFVAPAGVKGARMGDIKSMARIVRGAGPIIALTAVEFIGKGMQQAVNNSIDSLSNRESSTMDLANAATGGLGIFGGNLPLNFHGAFMERILQTTEQIAVNTAKDVQGFSPELISAQVDSSIAMLEDNMRRADEFGPMLAGIERSRSELELAMNRFTDSFLTEFGPLLVTIDMGLAQILDMLSTAPQFLRGALEATPAWGGVISLMWDIGLAKIKSQQNVRDLPDIEDFLHPNADTFGRNKNRLGI